VIATQRAFAVRTERRLFDIGLYLEMNGSGSKDDPFEFSDDPVLGASPASPGSGSLGSEESGETISIKDVRPVATPMPTTRGQRARKGKKRGPRRLAAMQPTGHGGCARWVQGASLVGLDSHP